MPPKVEPLPVTLYPSYPALEEEKKKHLVFMIYLQHLLLPDITCTYLLSVSSSLQPNVSLVWAETVFFLHCSLSSV